MSTEANFQDTGDGLANVRSDASDTNWAIYGHVDGNPNEVCFLDSGSGGPEEFASRVDDAQYLYGLLRFEETIDMSTTVKFVYVHWMGKSVPFVKRGKFGVVQGSIENQFSPYHLSLEADSPDELTADYIMTKIQENSGTKSKVLEASEGKARPERGFTSGTTTKMDSFVGSTPTKSAALTNIGRQGSSFKGFTTTAKSSVGFKIDDQVNEGIREVRSDENETNWCAVGYEGNNPKNPLILLGSGKGTVEDIRDFCKEDNAVYGLFRVTDVVDDIPTVKFAFIQWVGESLKPMAKAKISTYKGSLEDLFKPFHVSIFATSSSEINQRVVMDKVMAASGSKSYVK